MFPIEWRRPATLGLVEKALALVSAGRGRGLHIDGVFAERRGLRVLPHDGLELIVPRPERVGRVGHALHAHYRYRGFWNDVRGLLQSSSYSMLWVRAFPASATQVELLEVARERGLRVVYDLPTYPTAGEPPAGLARYVLPYALPLKSYARLIDRYVTLSEHRELFGVSCLRVSNGVAGCEVRGDAVAGSRLTIVGLGQWAEWHGVDRVLDALARLSTDRRPRLRLAGDGPAVAGLRRHAQRLYVDVEWIPPVFGADRAAVLARGDVGLGCLGIHRKGVFPDRALKHRLYAAHGLPFIVTTADDTWAGNQSVMTVPASEEPIDEVAMVKFIQTARERRGTYAKLLQARAGEQSWDRTYGEVWAYFASQTALRP